MILYLKKLTKNNVGIVVEQQKEHAIRAREYLEPLHVYLNQQVVGQTSLTQNMLIALLADGHLLVEGPPGLAKTRAINALADGIEGDFHRVQFTPDLLPADLTGTDIFRPETGEFVFQSGPRSQSGTGR